MTHPLIRAQHGKYVRALKLQEEYKRRGIKKPLIDCYTEIDLEDRAGDLLRGVQRGIGGFKL